MNCMPFRLSTSGDVVPDPDYARRRLAGLEVRIKAPLFYEETLDEVRDWFQEAFAGSTLFFAGAIHLDEGGVLLRLLPETAQQSMMLMLRWQR